MNISAVLNKLDQLLTKLKDIEKTSHRILSKLSGHNGTQSEDKNESITADFTGQSLKPDLNAIPVILKPSKTDSAKNRTKNTHKTGEIWEWLTAPATREWLTLLIATGVAVIYWLQLGAMQQSMKIDERPWVRMTVRKPEINEGFNLTVQQR